MNPRQLAGVISLFRAIGCNSATPQQGGRHEPASHPSTQLILTSQQLESMSGGELHRYLDNLGKHRQFAELTAISKLDIPFADYAITVLVRSGEPAQGVKICRELEGSLQWISAIYGLRDHPKESVIPYLREKASSATSQYRCECYRICLMRGWDDLLQYAIDDVDNTDSPGGLQPDRLETVGGIASGYVEACLQPELFPR